MAIQIIFVLIFTVLGIVFSMGKGSFLIAGFNTLTKEEKEKYDIISMCKLMGKFMFITALT